MVRLLSPFGPGINANDDAKAAAAAPAAAAALPPAAPAAAPAVAADAAAARDVSAVLAARPRTLCNSSGLTK